MYFKVFIFILFHHIVGAKHTIGGQMFIAYNFVTSRWMLLLLDDTKNLHLLRTLNLSVAVLFILCQSN